MDFGYALQSELDQIIELRKISGVYNPDEDLPDTLKKVIDFDQEAICIIKAGSQIIASCMIVYHPFQTFIYRFSVHKDFQNKGTGSKLCNHIEYTLKSKKMLHPTLFVETDNLIGIEFRKKQGRENLYKVECFVKNLEN